MPLGGQSKPVNCQQPLKALQHGSRTMTTLSLATPWGRIPSEGETAYFQQSDSPPLNITCHLRQHRALWTAAKSCQRMPTSVHLWDCGKRGGHHRGGSTTPAEHNGVYLILRDRGPE